MPQRTLLESLANPTPRQEAKSDRRFAQTDLQSAFDLIYKSHGTDLVGFFSDARRDTKQIQRKSRTSHSAVAKDLDRR